MGIIALSALATDYTIVAGIDDYLYFIPLTYVEKDAKDIATLLTGRGYGNAVIVEAQSEVNVVDVWYEGNNRISGNTRYSWNATGNKTFKARYAALTRTVGIEARGNATERLALTAEQVPTPEEMVLIKARTFQMGNVNDDSEGAGDEKPVHTVILTYDYWMGKTEVTFDDYDAFCNATGKGRASDYSSWAEYSMGRGQRPVINVSWNDAIAYCNWLSEQEGIAKAYDSNGNLLDENGNGTTDITKVKGYRLPTEAEWENAAWGGQNAEGYKYAGSDALSEVGWFWQNSGDKWLPGTDDDWDGEKLKANKNKTQPVGGKKGNELGLYDMSGNVWEWCHDWYGDYPSSTQMNPTGPDSGFGRVLRGGSWFDDARLCRVASRDSVTPVDIYSDLGFRLSRTAF
jgi:formylglycine-generating enzyme required for sulfatase activity